MTRRPPLSPASPLVTAAVAALATVATLAALAVTPTQAQAAPAVRCPQQYVYLHDMAGTATEMADFADTVGTPEQCSFVADYGRTRLTDAVVDAGGAPVAGFAAIDDSAAQVADLMRAEQRTGAEGWTVVAHGAGALVAQRVVQTQTVPKPITGIVAIGPMWRGTNIGFLGDTEDISRRLGTYDAVLRLEKPLIDPWCEGCRELVRGSDLLVSLRRAGLPSHGVRYTNVISPIDGLVSDPLSAALPGMDNRILDPARTRHVTHHFALLSDPSVANDVRHAVGGSTDR
ncbi:lipase [Gordonia liuliyuniae]|uniref:Lipase n=1 Tax=Gordonia liuliyuniae TaxID=2911517 RepID=A0ABS9INN9_9ACTN|nr:lipase [Gordonia liuliyuniae]MCF8587174.1 lipase [Gordonia liuliyuniae]